MARVIWLVLVAVLPLAGQFASVRAEIRKQLVQTSVPSLAVAVVRDGRILWAEGFGWADREKRIAANEHTMYSLASISKPITATGLMVLVERGRIDLDKPVNDYLGAATLRARVAGAAQATVRRVANHTAGLPLHYHFFYADEPYRPPPMDETILRYGNLITPPGERYHYSNLGYGVLDYVISRVSGKSYEEFMRTEVFLPLGLTRTSVGIGPGLEANQAVRYGGDGLPLPFYDFDHAGGSAVYASAHDLARFAMFHLKAPLAGQKPVLSPESIDAMQRPTTPEARHSGYGIGWRIDSSRRGYRTVSHTGGMGGVATSLVLVPSKKLAVVALANASTPLPHRVTQEILSALLPNWQRVQSAPSRRSRFRPPRELPGIWKGAVQTYESEIPFTLRVMDSGQVHARLGSGPETRLSAVRWEDGRLHGQFAGDIATEDANRRPYSLRLELKLRGDVLNGACTALSAPGGRVGNALSHWVELKKEQ